MAASAPTPPRERLIAEGASARLFASHDASGRPAALKLSRDAACDPVLLAEAVAATRFIHPALLPVWEHGVDDAGRVWLLLPLLSGRTLSDWQPETAALLDALGPIADALDLLHHNGVGHADLKPANLLLRESEGRTELVLSDLGLISELGIPAGSGTPAYLSPARLDGRPFTWRDDLHAFAVLVFESLACCLPWYAGAGEALLKDIRSGNVRSLRAHRPELPGDLDGLFGGTLSGRLRDSSMMGWLDTVRACFGLSPLRRGLFLRPDSPGDAGVATREQLSSWLRKHLYSSTSEQVVAGHEELRSLEEFARGDVVRLRQVLEFLVGEQWLQDCVGQAIFAGEPGSIAAQLRASLPGVEVEDTPRSEQWADLLCVLPIAFTREDLLAGLPLDPADLARLLAELLAHRRLRLAGAGRYEGTQNTTPSALGDRLPPIPASLFDSLWSYPDSRPGDRLRLIGLAVASGAEALLLRPSHGELLDLIERAPGEASDSLRDALRRQSNSAAAECLLGLLDVVRLVRTDSLDSAIERYWSIDLGLDLAANAALNRTLVYQLTDSGRVQEAHAFLHRWRARHAQETAGTALEVQIAAREVNILATHGALAEAEALARKYQDSFAGRPGAWVLHMALTNLAEERGDSGLALAQAEAALLGLREEHAAPEMELDLLVYIAGSIITSSDRSRWDQLPNLFQRAEALAEGNEIASITHRLQTARARQLLYEGALDAAKQQLLRTRRDAERTGELKRAQYIDTSLFILAREAGDYQALLSDLSYYQGIADQKESAREVLSMKEEFALLQLAVGDLEVAADIVDLALRVATEYSLIRFEGVLGGIQGRVGVLRGAQGSGTQSLSSAIVALTAAHAFRDRNECQLELIAVDPEADPDGALIAAVIDHEEAVGERRLLPRAWQLESRRLRRAGAIREAALALQEAFRIAGTLVSPEHRWPLHVEAAELALAAGEHEAARADLERAVAILHDLSLQFTDPAVRERFLARPDRRAVLARLQALGA